MVYILTLREFMKIRSCDLDIVTYIVFLGVHVVPCENSIRGHDKINIYFELCIWRES
jgi:hypothetical protein